MPDQNSVNKPSSLSTRVMSLLVPTTILLMAAGIVFLIAGNWNTWASGRVSQQTDDAYLRADLTPLSTKVAGLVAALPDSKALTLPGPSEFLWGRECYVEIP